MTTTTLLLATCVALAGWVAALLGRRSIAGALVSRIDAMDRSLERIERVMQEQARADRTEAASAVRGLGDSLVRSQTALANASSKELQAFSGQLHALSTTTLDQMAQLRSDVTASLQGGAAHLTAAIEGLREASHAQVDRLRTGVEERGDTLRDAVDRGLREIQQDNAARLEQMRQTVDEKLQSTLDTRLGESFRQVSERLEQVSRGLGEMQALATGVGDLKRVLANVKARGVWGEVQLESLLEQVLARDQYDANVATNEGSGERVEFAVRLPGRSGHRDEPVWLPIDAKFPLEDYQALLEASDRADASATEEAGRRLEARVKACAKDIGDKYVNPPGTTDFGIMFLPIEGLYAEVLRRPGLADGIQRRHRVLLAGPTTLWALLSSLQMGFKTVAIERRSSEVWALLGAVKAEFAKFGKALDGVQRNLHHAASKIDDARKGTRAIERRLTDVQEMPPLEAAALLEGMVMEDAELSERLPSSS